MEFVSRSNEQNGAVCNAHQTCKELCPETFRDRQPVELILTDVDGTFLNSHNAVPMRNVEAFAEAQRRGIIVGLSTGRCLKSALYSIGPGALKKMEYDGTPGVYCNGACVYGRNGKIISYVTIPPKSQKMLLDTLSELGHLDHTAGYTDSDIYAQCKNHWTMLGNAELGEPEPIILDPANGGLYSIAFSKFVVCGNYKSLCDLRTDLTAKLQGIFSFAQPTDWILEALPANMNKRTGMDVLLKHLNVQVDRVVAIGDSENDVDMLRGAGISVVVSNSGKVAKEAAKYITVSNDDGALHAVLECIKLSV